MRSHRGSAAVSAGGRKSPVNGSVALHHYRFDRRKFARQSECILTKGGLRKCCRRASPCRPSPARGAASVARSANHTIRNLQRPSMKTAVEPAADQGGSCTGDVAATGVQPAKLRPHTSTGASASRARRPPIKRPRTRPGARRNGDVPSGSVASAHSDRVLSPSPRPVEIHPLRTDDGAAVRGRKRQMRRRPLSMPGSAVICAPPATWSRRRP